MAKVKDKATAFKNELSGSHTNKIVCKASSHELAGPKKKHVDYLLQLTNHPRCQYSGLVDLIAERLKHLSWVVVFKGLIMSHNLMSLGNEKFFQCIATRSHIFELDHFEDRSDALASSMCTYLRKYARYVKHLCIGYKTLGHDTCRLPTGSKSPFINMEMPKLVKTTSIVQDQMDLLLEIEFATSELTNGVVNTAFLMMYKDLIKLYTAYNDSIINLLEKFFEMKKSGCRETISFYRKFLLRQETVQRFLQLAEDVGVDKETHVNLRQVPEDLLPALETHLSEMDTTKKSSGSQPSPQIQAASERLQELREKDLRQNAPPSQSGEGMTSGFPSASEDVLEAQRKRFDELKKRAKETKPSTSKESSSSDKSAKKSEKQEASSFSGASDLLGIDSSSSNSKVTFDPWSANAVPQVQQVPDTTSDPFKIPSSSVTPSSTTSSTNDPWGVQDNSGTSGYQEVDLFSEIRGPDFNSVFGSGSTQKPSTTGGGGVSLNHYTMGGDILTPQAVGPHATTEEQQPRGSPQLVGLTSDVDSSLARAAANLTVNTNTNKSGFTKKPTYQWGAPKESVKTGGPNWQGQNLQSNTLQNQPQQGKSANWSSGMQGGHFPINPLQSQPPMMMGSQPMMMGGQGPGMMMVQQQPMMGIGTQPMMMGGQPMMMQQQQQPFMQQPNMFAQPQQQLDPFGQPQNAPLF